MEAKVAAVLEADHERMCQEHRPSYGRGQSSRSGDGRDHRLLGLPFGLDFLPVGSGLEISRFMADE